MNLRLFISLAGLFLLFTSHNSMAQQQCSSGSRQIQLIELYTSQGCSSCPPAERWISSLRQHPDLWTRFVPVVFHVDYWNYLGWKDPFSVASYSSRQRLLHRRGILSAVYTPAFVVGGKEWRGWYRRQPIFQSAHMAGRLHASINNDLLRVRFEHPEPLKLTVALLHSGTVTQVTAGENTGRSLRNDFTVTQLQSHYSYNGEWSIQLPQPNYTSPGRLAIALWVSPADSLIALQATGCWLD